MTDDARQGDAVEQKEVRSIRQHQWVNSSVIAGVGLMVILHRHITPTIEAVGSIVFIVIILAGVAGYNLAGGDGDE